jgi:flagellar motor switch protein FliM
MGDVAGLLVSCEVKLGSCLLSAEELSQLKIGDVIVFDQAVCQPLSFLVEGHSHCQVLPGLEGIKKVVVIK